MFVLTTTDIFYLTHTQVLALNEEIGKEGEEKETPLTIDRNAKVEEIDSRAIMDYLIFDRGSVLDLEEGEKEEKEDIGECAFGPGSASAQEEVQDERREGEESGDECSRLGVGRGSGEPEILSDRWKRRRRRGG